MTVHLKALYDAYVEWCACRSDLKGQEKRHFHRWLTRAHHQFRTQNLDDALLLRQYCRELQIGNSLIIHRGLGMATLTRYARPLMLVYLSLPDERRGDFADFLGRVAQECPTERALKRFLGLSD